MKIQNRDVFVHGILDLPRRCLHLIEAAAHDNTYLFAADPLRGAAAVHGSVAAAKYQHILTDTGYMFEGNTGEPFYSCVDIVLSLIVTW